MTSKRFGLKEDPTVAIAGGTAITAGQVLLVNGIPTVVPVGQTSVAAWAAAIGGSPTIAICDVPNRTHGAFLPVDSPHNMDRLGNRGLPIFEV
jgi:hypothetical protein